MTRPWDSALHVEPIIPFNYLPKYIEYSALEEPTPHYLHSELAHPMLQVGSAPPRHFLP